MIGFGNITATYIVEEIYQQEVIHMISNVKVKVLLNSFAALVILGNYAIAAPTIAQTCAQNCGARQIQFTPGEPVRLQMVNRTSSLIQVQLVSMTDTIPLLPGSEVEVASNFGTEPNVSVVFWDVTALAVKAALSRPEPNILRIELLPGATPGDRSVYMENDGKVRIF